MASLYLRGGVWWAKYRQGTTVIRTSTGCTLKRRAQDWIDIRAGKIAAGEPAPVKLDAVLYDELHQDLITQYETVGRLSTRKPGKLRSLPDVKRRMQHVLDHFRGWRAASVTESKIVEYIKKRQTEKVPRRNHLVSPATINRELSALKSVLRLAASHTPSPKLARVPRIPMLGESRPRQGFVEEASFTAIVSHLEPGAALAAWIAFEAAWRIKSEVLTLEWATVDVDSGCVRLVSENKTDQTVRTVYLSEETRRLLQQQRARVVALGTQLGRIIPDVFVHTGKGPLQGRRVKEFSKAWRSACVAAGYTGTLLHDLRRSGVRVMVRSGVPESVAMKISGHATVAVFKRYDIVSDQDLKDARDRRAQFGHSLAAKVVSLKSQVANK